MTYKEQMKMTYDERMKQYEEEQRKLKAELEQLLVSEPLDVLKKRFCRNFGCINFCSDEFAHELRLARLFHGVITKADPDAHKLTETEPYRCYHKTSCRCGFSEACDSGD